MNKTKQLKIEKHNRRVRRAMRALANQGVCLTTPKYGVRPLSILHPRHPARLYGWDDERTINRDKARWE